MKIGLIIVFGILIFITVSVAIMSLNEKVKLKKLECYNQDHQSIVIQKVKFNITYIDHNHEKLSDKTLHLMLKQALHSIYSLKEKGIVRNVNVEIDNMSLYYHVDVPISFKFYKGGAPVYMFTDYDLIKSKHNNILTLSNNG
jgi:hypothetical protein